MRKITILLVVLFFSGCSAMPAATPSPEPLTMITPKTSPVANLTPTTIPETKKQQKLSIWVPEQFDPAKESPAAKLLQTTIDDFVDQNPNVTVEIRVKADTGVAGLMESLTLTSAAAPDAMPSLVLLNRSQMEEIASKGIIFPYEGLTATLDETDWFPFAKELATFQDDIYGLPLTGDALVLVMRNNRVPSQSPTWEEIEKMGSAVLFAAADPQAAVPLALYRSAGGGFQDIQSAPQIGTAELEKTLTMLASGAEKNIFPTWLINYQTDKQAMDLFATQQGVGVITWLTNYLTSTPPDTSLFPLPSLGAGSATYASGTVWALTDTNPERRQLSVQLAEFLTRSEFLTQWNLLNNSLPPRPSALTAWPDTPLRTQLNQVALAAQVRPPSQIMATLGPVVQEATILILKKQSDPVKAAKTAQERLTAPASK
jgi:multiple sugar transport system substrate-binding protein